MDNRRSRIRGDIGFATARAAAPKEDEDEPQTEPRTYPANRFFPDGYAVWDWQSKGFVRSGMMGQQVFESYEEARQVAGDQQLVVKLARPDESDTSAQLTDLDVAGEACEPLLDIRMNADVNVEDPSERIELENGISEKLTIVDRFIYTATISGPAEHSNFAAIAKLNTAEFWDSLDRKVNHVTEWLDEEGIVDDPGRDLSITLAAGDPEMMIREIEAGHTRPE